MKIEIDIIDGVKQYIIETISVGELCRVFDLINHRPIGDLKKRTQVKLLTILTGYKNRLDRKVFSNHLTPEERVSIINSLMAFSRSQSNSRVKIQGGIHVQTEA